MGERTGIAWTHHSWSPWWGCTKVSDGCKNCYAEAMDSRFGASHWGLGVPRREMSAAHWREPIRWDRAAAKAGERRRVFPSMCDLFDLEAPVGARERFWSLILRTPDLNWILLTKRPEIAAEMWPWRTAPPPSNVWLGVSVENQAAAEERIPRLLEIPAAVRFLSCEPLIGPVDLRGYLPAPCRRCAGEAGDDDCEDCHGVGYEDLRESLDWVIVGGESGPGARPCDLAWIRSILARCRAAGLPAFVKQLGACASDSVNGIAGAALKVPDEATALISRRLRDRAGCDMAEWPEDLRVQETPKRTR